MIGGDDWSLGQPNDIHDNLTGIRANNGAEVRFNRVHGNAVGIGATEFCRSRVIREMDTAVTRLNALTAGDLTAAMLPLDYETDAEILEAALPMIGLRPPTEARILWIRNTLQLAEAECSSILLEEAGRRSDLEVASELRPLPLDHEGNLPDRIVFSGEETDV